MRFFKLPFQPALFLALLTVLSCSTLQAQSPELGIRIDKFSLSTNMDPEAPSSNTDLGMGIFFQVNKPTHYLRFGADILVNNRYSEVFYDALPGHINKYERSQMGGGATFEIGKTWSLFNFFRVHLGFETGLERRGDRNQVEQYNTFDFNGNISGREVRENILGGFYALTGKVVLRADARVGKRFLFGAALGYGSSLSYQSLDHKYVEARYAEDGLEIFRNEQTVESNSIRYNPAWLPSPTINISYRLGKN